MIANVISVEAVKIENETFSKCLVLFEGQYGVAWVKGIVEVGDTLTVAIKPGNNLRFSVRFSK